jgi:MFS family permease
MKKLAWMPSSISRLVPIKRPWTPLRRDLLCCTYDGWLYTFMTGLIDSSLAVFALEMGLGDANAGLIQTVPLLLASVIGLSTPLVIRRIGGYRRYVSTWAVVQGLTATLLVILALLGSAPTWLVFLAATMHFSGATVAGPAWIAWSSHFVPHAVRARYFARRNRHLQIGLLCGLVLSGWILQSFPTSDQSASLTGFAIVFALGGLARLGSAWFMRKTRDAQSDHEEPIDLSTAIRPGAARAEIRFITFAFAATFALNMAQPFWQPFAREHLGFEYLTYFLLFAAMILGKIVATFPLGALADRHGPRTLAILSVLLLAPAPLLWLWAGPSVPVMATAQFLAGAGVQGLELSIILLQLGSLNPRQHTALLSVQTLITNFATVVGSVVGAQILIRWGKTTDGYTAIFIAAAVARACAVLLAWRLMPHTTDKH